MGTPEAHPESETPFFDLVAFLVSSARGALEEGVYTASLRLIEAAGRLAALAADQESNEFLRAVGGDIHDGATTSYLRSADEYVAFLDRVLEAVAAEVRRRNALSPD
jgi:hypothetical protein